MAGAIALVHANAQVQEGGEAVNDTPRTNHMLTAILETHGHVGFLNCPPAWVAFARELERELNAANQRVADHEKYVSQLESRLRALWDKYDRERAHYMDRIKRLEDEGDKAMKVMFTKSAREALEIWTKAKEAKP